MFRAAILVYVIWFLAPFISRAQNFNLDDSFKPAISGALGVQFSGILDLAVQTDGQVIVVGSFTNLDGKLRNGIARLNPDGSSDDTFDAGTGPNSAIWSVALDSAGRILVGGEFTTWNEIPTGPLVRLLPNGDLDLEFYLGGPTSILPDAWLVILDLHVQDDQQILLSGTFTHYFEVFRPFLARITDQGLLDESYAPDPQNLVIPIHPATRSPRQIYIAGGFGDIANQPRPAAALLFDNGSLDPAFNPPLDQGDIAWDIVDTPEGAVYVGGDLSGLLRRFDSSGNPDPNFTVSFAADPNSFVASLLPLAENTFVGGYFDGVNDLNRSCLILLHSDGSVNEQFGVTGANDLVNKLLFDSSGNLLVAGLFTHLDGEPRSGLARYLRTIPEIQLLSPVLAEGQLHFSFLSETGASYELQSAALLTSDWTLLSQINGTGAEISVSQPTSGPSGFFRIRRIE